MSFPLGLRHDPENAITLELLAAIDAYDFSVPLSYARYAGIIVSNEIEGVPEVEIVRSIKRNLSLEILDSCRDRSVDTITDRLWHAMVLNTAWYETFCNSIFGQMIHHDPLAPKGPHADDDTEASLVHLFNFHPFSRPGLIRPGMPGVGRPRFVASARGAAPSAAFAADLQREIDENRNSSPPPP